MEGIRGVASERHPRPVSSKTQGVISAWRARNLKASEGHDSVVSSGSCTRINAAGQVCLIHGVEDARADNSAVVTGGKVVELVSNFKNRLAG